MSSIIFLILFHLIFFWKVYSDPFSMARSELLSTFFPSWIHLGRGEKNDPYYWLVPDAHPVLSTYYLPHFIAACYSRFQSLENSWMSFLFILFSHFFFASIGWYLLISTFSNPLVALFGALTLTYGAYNIKQQPCLVYTIAWTPWLLTGIASHNILLTSGAFGMVILAGYYPIGVQTTLIAAGASILWGCSLLWVPIGLLIGAPQLIPFLKYLPKTIRTNKVSGAGKVPWWHPITLIFPLRLCLNGVGYWEMAYYVGIVPLVLIASSTSRAWLLAVVSYLLMTGLGARYLPRIPARWCWSFQLALGWCAVSGLTNLHLTERVLAVLLGLQAFDLIWHNADLIPTSPYCELPNRPKWAFNTRLTRFLSAAGTYFRVSGLPYPLFTGHINKIKTLGYSGGMQLKLMAKWRKDTDPNGSGQHDWFKANEDDESLDRARVRYAYTTARTDWEPTPVRHLYHNPRIPAG